MLNKIFQQHFFNELTKIVSTLSLVCKTHVPIILPIKSFLTSAYLSKVLRQEHVFYDTYISCFKHYVQVNIAGKSRLSNLSLENQDYPICHWKIKATQFVTQHIKINKNTKQIMRCTAIVNIFLLTSLHCTDHKLIYYPCLSLFVHTGALLFPNTSQMRHKCYYQ